MHLSRRARVKKNLSAKESHLPESCYSMLLDFLIFVQDEIKSYCVEPFIDEGAILGSNLWKTSL